MKYDGHMKITSAAIDILDRKCRNQLKSCFYSSGFKNRKQQWKNSKTSNKFDNTMKGGEGIIMGTVTGVVTYILNPSKGDITTPPLYLTLPGRTAYEDFDRFWTHGSPEGQKYHFMRNENQNNATAAMLAKEFIFHHGHEWFKLTNSAMYAAVNTYSKEKAFNSTRRAKIFNDKKTMRHLSAALHSLQDSFSTSHADRFYGPSTKNQPVGLSPNLNKPPPIRNMYVYKDQNHDMHGKHDYISGSINSYNGQLAVHATAEFLFLLIKPLITRASYSGAEMYEFKNKWLATDFSPIDNSNLPRA